MSKEFERLVAKLSEHGTAGRVSAQHDAASLSSPISGPRVRDSHEFACVIGAFVNRQVQLTGGAGYPDFEARTIAKEILSKYGERRGQGRTYANYARNAIDGQDGGLRGVLNILAEVLREQQTERYREDAVDQIVDPLDFEAQVAITKKIMDDHKQTSSVDIGNPRPEAHAHQYRALIRRRVQQIDDTTKDFRGH
jgi:hypothetical protein